MHRSRTQRLAFIGLATLICLATPALVRAHEAGVQMASMAKFFLSALTPEQRAQASFKFEDEERINWHFIPKERKGLAMREMTPQQRLLAHALLNTGLGFRAAAKAVTIMSLEEVLYTLEGKDKDDAKRAEVRERRNPEKYFVSIFGEPGDKGTWGWRVEGHHMSLNFTIKDGELLRATPSFMGSNPGEIREGPLTGLRVLGREEDLGRELVKSLTDAQWAKASVAAVAPKDVITEAEKKVAPLKPDGLSETELNAEQKAKLHEIIREYIDRARPEIAEETWKTIQKEGAVFFAWAGGKERGEGHYYRIQGKSFLLEYDNTQNNANHPHSVWRSFDGDFGRDLLAEHMKEAHGKK
jgi:Spy/CpxP family protein refolding chaperone